MSIKRKPTLKILLGVTLKTTTRGQGSLFRNKTSGPNDVSEISFFLGSQTA